MTKSDFSEGFSNSIIGLVNHVKCKSRWLMKGYQQHGEMGVRLRLLLDAVEGFSQIPRTCDPLLPELVLTRLRVKD